MSESENTTERPAQKSSQKSTWMDALASDDRFRPADMLGPGAFLDAGLPLALFTTVYIASGRNLTVALWTAIAAGVLLVVVRLARRDRLQNVIAGFVGLGVSVWTANRTGEAADIFLPSLLINVGYGVAYLISILVRWPLLGVVVGLVTGQGTSWRSDPALMRAYTKASALFVGLFAARLAVKVPLYLAGDDQLGWLATAQLAMSWPLFALVAYMSYVIIRPAYRAHQAAQAAQE